MLKSDTEKIRIKKFNYKNLKILVSVSILILICIVALDNYFYQRVETFAVSETYTLTPTHVISDFQVDAIDIPTVITINGNVTKKVNPAITKEGFFNYSYRYDFYGVIQIGEFELNYNTTPLISTMLKFSNEFELYASPFPNDMVEINNQIYGLGITMYRDLNYELFHLQVVIYGDNEQKVAIYNYDI